MNNKILSFSSLLDLKSILIKIGFIAGMILISFISGCVYGKNSQKLKYLLQSQQLQQDINKINTEHENIQDRPY